MIGLAVRLPVTNASRRFLFLRPQGTLSVPARLSMAALLMLAAMLALAGCAPVLAPAHEVTQISTYPALERGMYDGDMTYGQLAQAGNFGIGTFDGMDGEMIALDGQFYQARTDGSVRRAEASQETPFATVTFFTAQQHVEPPGPLTSYDEIKSYLSQVAPPGNEPYAIRVKGRFPYLKIRSVPRQSEPYPPLTDVIAKQVTWDRKDISGTLVGYWFPQYLSDLNAPGYHLHFISDDRQVAGHFLEGSVEEATIDIDRLDRVTLEMPQTPAFTGMDLSAQP